MRVGMSQPRLRRVRAAVYDAAIVPMTAQWYAAVLDRLPEGCHLLDVGIGTGAALLENAAVLRAKGVHVTGIDIDADYVERCRETVTARGLAGSIDVRLQSVYDHAGGPYGAAYFSGSFMLLPDPVAALRRVATLLAPDARVYFTQTFEHRRSWLLERVKPLLRFVTSIDFGSVTYEADFREAVAEGGFEIEAQTPLHQGKSRSSVLVVARASSRAKAAVPPHATAATVADEESDWNEDDPVVVPIEDALDLHTFQPRDIPDAVEGYLEAAVEAGFREVRLIHGRGTGFQRDRVRGILAKHPAVESFADAPPHRGGWGATIAVLKPKP
jgi:SAM-dependent methyltransferase